MIEGCINKSNEQAMQYVYFKIVLNIANNHH